MRNAIYKILKILVVLSSCSADALIPNVIIVFSTGDMKSPTYVNVVAGIKNIIPAAQQYEFTGDIPLLQKSLDSAKPDKVIALGRNVIEAVDKTTLRDRALSGLIYFKPESSKKGVSLSLNGQELFKQIKTFLPSVKRIFVIQQKAFETIDYSPSKTLFTPSVEMIVGDNSLNTIRILGRLLDQMDSPSDVAVIVPANLQDNILYEVVKVAWDKHIALLSTNLGHLENGVLISIYPNDFLLGKQLGRLAASSVSSFQSVEDMKYAVNLRVAKHLEIDFESNSLEKFSFIIQ